MLPFLAKYEYTQPPFELAVGEFSAGTQGNAGKIYVRNRRTSYYGGKQIATR